MNFTSRINMMKKILDSCTEIDLEQDMAGTMTYNCTLYDSKLKKVCKVSYSFYRELDREYNHYINIENSGMYLTKTDKNQIDIMKFLVTQKMALHKRYLELICKER